MATENTTFDTTVLTKPSTNKQPTPAMPVTLNVAETTCPECDWHGIPDVQQGHIGTGTLAGGASPHLDQIILILFAGCPECFETLWKVNLSDVIATTEP